MGITADTLVRGHQFDGATGLKSGENLEDLVTRATLAAGSELLDQDTLETFLDAVLGVYRARVKDGGITTAKLADGAVTAGKLAEGAAIPPGAMMSFPMNAPAGWLECDGSAVSRSTYAALFAAIGTVCGSGDGATTFNLPNAKGRVLVGYDSSQTEFDAIGEAGGAKTHTLSAAEMPAHTHTAAAGATHGTAFVGNNQFAVTDLNEGTRTTNSAGSGGAHNNLQPYLVIKWCIKT
jgi:microcystin-dependent protein